MPHPDRHDVPLSYVLPFNKVLLLYLVTLETHSERRGGQQKEGGHIGPLLCEPTGFPGKARRAGRGGRVCGVQAGRDRCGDSFRSDKRAWFRCCAACWGCGRLYVSPCEACLDSVGEADDIETLYH